ncbi:MAG: hypothetical protein WAO58_03290 [Fimbriimonadaceae bacterium]
MRVLGCNVTAGGIYFVEVAKNRLGYDISTPQKLLTPQPIAQDLSRAMETVKAILRPGGEKSAPITTLGMFGCTSGTRGSSVAAIKAETAIQLAADSLGIRVEVFHPAAFFKMFKDSEGKNWSDRARHLLDPEHDVLYWNSGVDGAICAAIRAADTGTTA